ncbi:hypothetical protein VTJ04DRAFT_1442 [Mycothermus thermophilus]|uniref:uncharacterized protein n=1 Tax=Humicola insolens TaxID=85995 RepID=UPI003744311E
MKLQSLLTSLLASAALATPVRRDVDFDLYTLKISTNHPALDGLYLGPIPAPGGGAKNATAGLALGVVPGTQAQSGIIVYPVASEDPGLTALHTIDGGAVLVAGRHGVLDLAAFYGDPASAPVPEGVTIDWDSFQLVEEGAEVLFANAKGRWVAFPSYDGTSGWRVTFKETTAFSTTDYVPVSVVYESIRWD